MKQITYSATARKSLLKIPRNESAKIIRKIEQYASEPESLSNNVKKLQGINALRLRVGDWRVIFTEDLKIIQVVKIAARGEAYR